MAETFCIMVQGLTFGKGPTTNCLLVNLSTFIYCFKKKKKKAQNKTFVDISIYFFFSEGTRTNATILLFLSAVRISR